MSINNLHVFKDKYGDKMEFYVSGNLKQCSVSYRTESKVPSMYIESLEDLQRFAATVERFIEDASEIFTERKDND
jgi:hypothetical protein